MAEPVDPFEAFGPAGDGGGDGDGDGDRDATRRGDDDPATTAAADPPAAPPPPAANAARDPHHGVLRHHDGTEQALLQFVASHFLQQEDDAPTAAAARDDGSANPIASKNDDIGEAISRCQRILTLVDNFCRSRHWMMHVGDEKGPILEKFLSGRLEQTNEEPFWILELGSYCGYSTILMAKTCLLDLRRRRRRLQEIQEGAPTRTSGDGSAAAAAAALFHIVTVDVNPTFSRVARRIVQLAGIETYVRVQFVLLPTATSGSTDDELSPSALRAMQEEGRSHFGFCFIDHDKDMYLPDLLRLEKSKLVRRGTYVCADNVVFFRLDNYRNHVMDLARRGVVRTRLELSRLEYVIENSDEGVGELDVRDGLELTEYLTDPPVPSEPTA